MNLPSRACLAGSVATLAAVAVLASGCASSASNGATNGTTLNAAGAGPAALTNQVTIKLTSGRLTDGTGRTVYLWLADKASSPTCVGPCATVWPPVSSSSAPTAGSGAVAADLGTTTRADGTTQVTYAGHPLYYFEGDTSAGKAAGQGSDSFGAKWWELTASGAAITTTATSAAATHPATRGSSTPTSSRVASTNAVTHAATVTTHSSAPTHPAPSTSAATHSTQPPPPSSSSPGGGYGY
jgi:predicted lipoprotein with Yx(FWY)xxD motif